MKGPLQNQSAEAELELLPKTWEILTKLRHSQVSFSPEDRDNFIHLGPRKNYPGKISKMELLLSY